MHSDPGFASVSVPFLRSLEFLGQNSRSLRQYLQLTPEK